jgi:hypothetical protein
MNTDIDKNDCIVLQTGGSEVGKRSAGSAGLKVPADAGCSSCWLIRKSRAPRSRSIEALELDSFLR